MALPYESLTISWHKLSFFVDQPATPLTLAPSHTEGRSSPSQRHFHKDQSGTQTEIL
jgi:hypothetical protein